MAKQTVTIIGAGIGGLTLGRCLLHRGVSTIVYEKAVLRPRNLYAITLHPSSYRPLLPILGLDEQTFRSRVAVDNPRGLQGELKKSAVNERGAWEPGSLRVHRGRFEELLREGLDVKWEHAVEKLEHKADGNYALNFTNGETVESKLIVAADGVHSTMRRSLLPNYEPRVLPVVAFNGRRKVDRSVFEESYGPSMEGSTMLQKQKGKSSLTISITEEKDEEINITWIYSRLPQGPEDPLYKPNRAQAAATETPEEFFQEVSDLKDLEPPFKDVFDVARLRNERILHWLMRTTAVATSELQNFAKEGVVFLGDSVHAEPILGGNGANAAIQDALSLAAQIATVDAPNLENWYEGQERSWTEGVKRSERIIAEMHTNS